MTDVWPIVSSRCLVCCQSKTTAVSELLSEASGAGGSALVYRLVSYPDPLTLRGRWRHMLVLGRPWWRGTSQREQTGCGQQPVPDRRMSVIRWVTWEGAHAVGDVESLWSIRRRSCVGKRQKSETEYTMSVLIHRKSANLHERHKHTHK